MAVLLGLTVFPQYMTPFWRTSLSSLSALRGAVQYLYDFPTSSEGRLPNIVDAQKKRQYTPLEIETVIHSERGACHGSSILRSASQSPTTDDPASHLDARPIGSGHRDVKELDRHMEKTPLECPPRR